MRWEEFGVSIIDAQAPNITLQYEGFRAYIQGNHNSQILTLGYGTSCCLYYVVVTVVRFPTN